MEEPAPPYEEAIRRKDWIEIVAPYVDVRDYTSLCRVSQKFYSFFANRLWKDPLNMLRELCNSTTDEAHSYSDFVDHMKTGVRKSTASLVAVMDFRVLTMQLDGLALNKLNSAALADIPARFPNLRCLLLNNRSGLDPSLLARNLVLSRNPHCSLENLNLLSLANCGLPLPARFSVDKWLIGLVYLDLSNTPGSLQSQIDQNSLKTSNLPHLRILKITSKNLDSAMAGTIIREFGTRLWSFDVSSNKLDDLFMNDLTNFSLPTRSIIKLRAPRHFDVEGKIRPLVDNCGNPVGDYYFIDESAWSATFTCPDRYLADTPVYRAQYADGADTERTSRLRTRSNGRGRPRGDSAAEITRVLAGGAGEPIPDPPHLRYSPHWPPREVGATHLHLNDLKISAPALERLLRLSPGFIEHFECDGPVCLTNEPLELGRKAPWLSKSAFLRGVPGLAYLFRPVISSNLRVLKIHHSLVTNVPTVVSHDGDVLAKFWLAETILRERVDLAHPQTYVPDMNPRLYSLTLCMIPRYSTGVVTERLVNFLKLAAKQEQMIEKVRATMPPRGPPVLEGLRHICLEFEPDTDDELVSLEDDDDDDGPNAGALLSQGPEAFSFFGESAWDAPSSPADSKPTARRSPAAPAHTNPPAPSPTPEDLSSCYPFSRSEGEHVTISHEVADAHGRGQALTLPVWVGPGTVRPANAPAVNEYMRTLSRDPASSASGVVAATPCHVAAGVPAGELIFRRAWDMMMLLSPATTASTAIGGGGGGGGGVVEKTITPPGRAALRSGVMRDVLVEIKGFRRRAGGVYGQMEAERRERGGVWVEGEHEYWRGKLTVEVPQGRAQSSEYWR